MVREAVVAKWQPPMEEIKATPLSKVGNRLFNEDVDCHGFARTCMYEMSSGSGFFFFQVSGIPSAVVGIRSSRH